MNPMIDVINASPYKLYIALAGGGQSFVCDYLSVGGASATIAGVNIPYSKEMFEKFLGYPVVKFVSDRTARLLATKSYEYCLDVIEPKYAIGIGVTCSLATVSEREGRIHKICIALHSYESSTSLEIELDQQFSRAREEEIVGECIMSMLHNTVIQQYPTQLNIHSLSANWSGIIKNDLCYQHKRNFLTELNGDIKQLGIMPGSYNPFHEGHRHMLTISKQILSGPVFLEMSCLNADKGVIDYFEVKNRLSTIDEQYPVVLTMLSTFRDKAEYFYHPNRELYFIIGADTWNRMLNPKYAGPMEELYNTFKDLNILFIVFGRFGIDIMSDQWLDKLRVGINDERLYGMNVDVSSTKIREGV